MMKLALTVALYLGVWLGLSASADAQIPFFGRFGTPDNSEQMRVPSGSGTNPEHERKKTEADKANQAGDFAKVIELMDDVLRQNPLDAVAHYLRASARVELGARQGDTKLIREGIADSREAIRNDKQRTSMYYLPYLHGMKTIAVLENKREHAEVAVTFATQILNVQGLSNDDKANLLYQRSQAQGFLGKTDQAIADMQEALRLVPNHYGARAAIADLYAAAGKPAEALAAFNKLVESYPDNPLTYNNRGKYVQGQGKLDDAIIDFTRALERDPNFYYAYTNRGYALLQMDNPTAAEADFNQSLKLNPQQPFLYNLRGLSKLARNDVAGALQDQRAAVDMNPRDPLALSDLGFLMFYADDFSGAVAQFDAAQAIDPEFRHLIPWKIAALKRLGQGQNLKQTFSGNLAKDPKQRDWIDHLVVYLLDAEPEASLLAAADTAAGPLKADQTCEAEYFIALSRLAAGKKAEATAALQQAVGTKSRQLAAYRGAQFLLKKLTPTAPDAAAAAGAPPTIPGK